MKQRFRHGMKAAVIGVLMASSGVAAAAPAFVPQTIMAEEAEYVITRNIKLYIKQADGSNKLYDTLPLTMTVPGSTSKDKNFTFPAVNVSDLLGDGFEAYTPDKTTIPSAQGSYNKPPADASVVLSIDPQKGLTEEKRIVRTIEYYIKDSDGKERLSGSEQYFVIFPRGSVLTATANFPDKKVDKKEGYTSDRTVVKGKTVKASDESFTEKVIYTKNADVTTETKTVWRKVNFIDKDTGKKIKGSQSKGVTFSREVYKDANGKTVVVRDWQSEGTIPEFAVPDIEGYSHTQKTVPAKKVTVKTKDFEVDVYYTSTRYTVNYHLDEKSSSSSKKTVVDYGTWTNTRTVSDLGFSKSGHNFLGWKCYREIDGCWYVKDANGNKTFKKMVNGELPAGYSFVLYKSGARTRTMAKRGDVHFYGVWEEQKYTVKYHLDENSSASSKTTTVKYGEWTKLLTLSELGFSKSGKKFAGWKLYREKDNTWYAKDSSGNKKFVKLVNGKLPSGYTFATYSDGGRTKTAAKSGVVHYYGTWK